MANALAYQSRLETDADALHFACCVKALLPDKRSPSVAIESSGTSSAPISSLSKFGAADQDSDGPASLSRQSCHSATPGEWSDLSRLYTAGRTAETKERVLHSMGRFVVSTEGGTGEHTAGGQVASRFLETVMAGCNPSGAPSTRLASVRALQVSGVFLGTMLGILLT